MYARKVFGTQSLNRFKEESVNYFVSTPKIMNIMIRVYN